MSKAGIAGLSTEERKIFIDMQAAIANDDHNSILGEALAILDRLLRGNISVDQLRALFGIELAKLKKHQEKS